MSTAQQQSAVIRTDEELAASLRRGEIGGEALEELYARHRKAVRSYAASCCRDPHTADDLTSEAFARTIDATRRGGGPRGPWRPYLLTAVRRIAIDWAADSSRAQPSDYLEDRVDEAPGGEELTLDQEENRLVVESFQRLPERWQTVLWYTAVKGEPAATVAARLGISESGVGSLAERAREGLREAYLSVHVHNGEQDGCGPYSRLLAIAVRRKGRRPGKDLKRHLAGCAQCRQALLDLTDLNSRLRAVLPGAILLGEGVGVLIAKGAVGQESSTAWAAASTLSDQPAAAVGSGATAALTKGAISAGASITLAVGGYFFFTPFENPLPTPKPPQVTSSAPAPVTPAPLPSPPAPRPSKPRTPATDEPSPSGNRSNPRQEPVFGLGSTLRSPSNTLCLEPAAPEAGAAVQAKACDGSKAQQWEQGQFLGAKMLMRNSATGLCLRSSGSGAQDDEQVTCDSGDARQGWQIQFSLEHSSMVAVGNDGKTYLT
ncbi:sigma-70 family RNA polymerase sigma factor [Streptomyces sp. NPDC051907]|uniref:sigma-70 family RNA polymerase sigma factor n=1 Tax=Streptomyces sp. NPDC051907 TaxID=3155284 RepID=UPI00343DB0C7